MTKATKRVAIAVKRTRRERVGRDWIAKLKAISGVELEGQSETRAQVRCSTEQTIEEIKQALGDDFIIEPIVERHTP